MESCAQVMRSFSLPLVVVSGYALRGHQCVDYVVVEGADLTGSATPLMRLLPDYSVTTLDFGWEAKMK